MHIIEEIREHLDKHPEIKYRLEPDSIVVLGLKGGFDVGISVYQHECTVSFGGWHEEFVEKEKAFNCFSFGLSDACRLRVYQRGTFVYRWIVESYRDSKWNPDSETGLFLFPFWRKKTEAILQNHFIKTA